MGFAKERWLEHQERGYTAPDERFVCAGCVTDPHLSAVLAEWRGEHRCSYCGAPGAAEIEVLLDEIGDAILATHTDPVHELPYETREGGYQGVVTDGSDLVFELT